MPSMISDVHRADDCASRVGSVRVSVVIVTYNHERFIAQAIDSVLAQRTDFDYEVIVSEDCSSDATRRIIEDYAARNPGMVRLLLSERNLNSNLVEGRAIAAAEGEYVALMDGDDFLVSPHKLQRQVDFFRSHPEHTLCYHNAMIVDQRGKSNGILHVKPHTLILSDLSSILAANPVPGSASMFRARALSALPGWVEGAPFGDWALYIHAAQQGLIGYLDEPLSAYRRHPQGQWTGMPRPQQYRALLAWYDLLARHLPATLADEIETCRNVYRFHSSYVTDVGSQFHAVYDTGLRFGDRSCTRPLKLQVQALQAMAGVRVVLSNLASDARLAGNSIEVRVDDMSRMRANLMPGERFDIEFTRPLAAGDTFTFEATSATGVPAPGYARKEIGFCLEAIEAIIRPR